MPVKTSLKDGKLHMKAKLNIAKTRNSGNGVENVDSKRKGAGRNKKVQSRGSTGDNVDYVSGIKSSSGKRSDKLRTRDGRKEVGDYGSEGLMSSSGKRSEKLRTRDGRKEVGDYGSEGLMSSSGKRNEKLRTRDGRKEVGDYGSEGLMSSSGKRSEKLRTRDGRKEVEDYGSEGLMLSSGKRSLKLRTKSERKTFGDDGNEGLMLNSRKRSTKLRTKDERREVRNDGNEGFKVGNLHKKRKKVYADQNLENVEISNGSNRKANAVIGNQTTKARSKSLEHTGVRSATEGRRKLKASESVENKNSRGLSKSNAIDKVENAEINGMLKKSGKGISERGKQLDQDLSKKVADNLKRSTKKKVRGNKSTGDDADKTEQKPKKKKRVIRIDPYDTSNKRLDDGLASNDGEEKKKDLPKTSNAELSKNAQFRAICPSPSILSFVEDNLLGRRREIEIKRAGYNIELSAPLDNIPFSTSTERERIEEPVFRNKLSFFAAAKVSSSFPPPELPEIAFAGRSNVGKSSLLNSLTRQWGVVRTSDKPGLTQTINFFKLGSKLCLVDLPGYGFAYAKEEVKEAWEELVKEYVSTRVGLKRVCLLVDTKWGMKPRDYELVDLMERSQTKYQIVLTKTDLVFPIDVARRAMQIEESLKQKKSAVQPVMMASSKSGAGIRSLRTALSKIARFVKP